MAGLPPDEVWRLFGAADDPGLRARNDIIIAVCEALGIGREESPEELATAIRKLIAERDEARRERDRLSDILDAERGVRGPDGWAWTPHDTWSRYSTGDPGASATVWRHADQSGAEWSWRVSRDLRGTAPTALEAMEAANRCGPEVWR